MKRNLYFAYPGDLQLPTGGYAYDRRLIEELYRLDWNVIPISLGEGFPFPSQSALEGAEKILSALPSDALILIDGLAFGVMNDWSNREAGRLKIIALVHHPLSLETGLTAEIKARLHETEKAALSTARHVFVTSSMTARELATHFQVPTDKITIAIPGTDPAHQKGGTRSKPNILSVGSLTPRKGHDILIAALAQIQDLDWVATIVGSKDMSPRTAAELAQKVMQNGLQQRITLTGTVEQTAVYFENADIFALASRYEGYGIVFAEAMIHGLPIVAVNAGAANEVIPPEVGILVPLDDHHAFADALRRLLSDPLERQKRSMAAKHAASLLPAWHDTAAIISEILDKFHE